MKKIILIFALTVIMLACTPKNYDGIYETEESMYNQTPYELRLVFSGGTIILLEGKGGYFQRRMRILHGNNIINNEFIKGETLDSIIFDNSRYIDLSEDAPHREYCKQIERLGSKLWGRGSDIPPHKTILFRLTISESEYNLSTPIPGKE